MCSICYPPLPAGTNATDSTNLSIPSFQRVTDIGFDDDRPVTKVRCVPAPPDDSGW